MTPKIPPEELLHEVIIRALQMVLNAWKRYLDCKKQERLEQSKEVIDVTRLDDHARRTTTIDAVGVDGGKATVSQQQPPR